MRLLVSGATATLRRIRHPDRLGVLVVPHAGNRIEAALLPGVTWAVDNAAFSGFDPVAFCSLLAKVARVPGCRFVACPDVVADADRTAELFEIWHPVIKALGLPVALVGQDGVENLPVPWERMDALFVGGSTEWKIGPAAAALVRAAKERGLWVHMGRVNTKKRFRHAFHLGCDSVDGSGFSQWPDQRIPVALRWMADLHGDPNPERSMTSGRYFKKSAGSSLTDLPGWSVTSVRTTPREYHVHARPAGEPLTCPRCGVAGTPPLRHGTRTTRVRDIPRHGRPVRVTVRYQRFRCRFCRGVFGQELRGVSQSGAFTNEVIRYADQERQTRSVGSVAASLGVNRKTLRAWMAHRDTMRHS